MMASDSQFPVALLTEQLKALAARFNEVGLQYALCGGMAVAAYGYVRFTKDIDFIIGKSSVDLAKEAAKSCGYWIDNGVLPFPQSRFDAYRLAKIEMNEVLPIDFLMLPDDDPMLARAVDAEIEGVKCRLVSLKDLVDLKTEAGRANDLVDIEQLRLLYGDLA